MNKIRESCPDLRHNLNLAVQIFDSTRWQFGAGHDSEKCKTCSRSSIVSKLGVRVACPLCHSVMWNDSWWMMWLGHIFQIHAHLDQKQPAWGSEFFIHQHVCWKIVPVHLSASSNIQASLPRFSCVWGYRAVSLLTGNHSCAVLFQEEAKSARLDLIDEALGNTKYHIFLTSCSRDISNIKRALTLKVAWCISRPVNQLRVAWNHDFCNESNPPTCSSTYGRSTRQR